MDSRTEMPEYGADPAPSSNSEYLRALKRNETHTPTDPAPATALVPATSRESQPNSVFAGEKRRNPRYKCEGSAEFRTEGIDVRTWATVTDISRSGCYVEMQATSPRDTSVDMVIEVKGIRVQVKGTVRTSYPLLGMGITFTDITEPDQARLDELLLWLASGNSPHEPVPRATSGISAAPDLLMITDPAAALNAIAKFFQTNRALSREDFTELLGESQNHGRGTRR
jgi:hypothetical protein